MTEDRVSQRGFTYYGSGPIEVSTGYRTRIEVYESSATLSRSRTAPSGEEPGPFLWVHAVQDQPVDGDHDNMRTVAVHAHLNRAEVAEYYARIGRWLEAHPAENEGDGQR